MTGIIPQEITLDVDLTVYENLIIFSKFFDIPKREARKRIAELLKFVELEAKRDSKISELSTGMKRRLLVARALLNQPKLIVADEPTTGLDPQARHLIWQRLRQLKSEGATLILTTQYMEEAQQLCDRIVVMYQGKILKEGVPRNSSPTKSAAKSSRCAFPRSKTIESSRSCPRTRPATSGWGTLSIFTAATARDS